MTFKEKIADLFEKNQVTVMEPVSLDALINYIDILHQTDGLPESSLDDQSPETLLNQQPNGDTTLPMSDKELQNGQ